MSKSDNLTDFLTDIADTIRARKGTSEPINPQNFSFEMEELFTKFSKLVDNSITEVTAEDLSGVTKISDYKFHPCKELKTVTIPDSVTTIGRYAFQGCSILKNVVIGNSVTKIGDAAFSFCPMESIVIPDSVTSIGTDAFWFCTELKSITIGSSVTSIGSRGFYSNSKSIKSTITMRSTTPPTISSNTFYSSDLNKIIVPKGTLDAYKSATNWAGFADYIEEAAE